MKKATRVSFGEEIARIGSYDRDIVVFDADLAKSTQSIIFGTAFPDRFFEMGIQEQNMIGTAAGMALAGKKPFICSFSTFVVSRFETIRMSIGYTASNVVIVGTHCGIGIGEDGYSQMALEDVALMRTLPNLYIVQPADDRETRAAVRHLAAHPHPAFLRLTRQAVEDVHDDAYEFRFGRADRLRDGSSVALFATGAVTAHAVRAAGMLAAQGIDCRVENIHTIKPLDDEAVLDAARAIGRIVTIEDHSVVGGLGGAVAELLAERHPARMLRIGIRDCYGESGSPDGLYAKYGLDADGIARQVAAFMRTA